MIEKPADARFGWVKNSQMRMITLVSSSRETESYDLKTLVVYDDDDDNDDENLISVKKHSGGGNYSTSVSCIQTPGYFSGSNKNTSSFSGYFFYISSNRYLLLQVFRV